MRHFPLPILLVSLVLTVPVVPAAPPAAEPTAARVAALIHQLGSPDFRSREDASRELVAVGEPALSAVSAAAATSEDREIARRAADAVARITVDVDTARTLTPALVELSADQKPLLEVLTDLQKQTGYPIGVTESGTATIPVTLKTPGKVPFWNAVEAVCAVASVHVVPDPSTLRTGVTYAGSAARASPSDWPLDPARVTAMHAEAVNAYSKAVLARAKATDAAEQKRLDQEVLKRRAELQKVAQHIADQVRSRPSLGPQPVLSVPIVFRPRVGAMPPSSVRGAVRVEVAPVSAPTVGALPTGVVPVMLHFAAEPRLKLERIESVRVMRAVDDTGRDLKSLPGADPGMSSTFPYPVAANVLRGPNGQLMLVSGEPSSKRPGSSPWQILVRLKADTARPESIRRLEGAVRAVVRTEPGELVTLTGLNPDHSVNTVANDVGLTVSAIVPTASKGEFVLDVTAHYKPSVVQASGGASGGTMSTMFVQNGGRVIVRRPNAGPVVINGAVAGWSSDGPAGVVLRDPEGRPLPVVVTRRERRITSTGNLTDLLTLTVTREPATVAFTGTRAKVVEVPFQFVDLPVASK